VAQVSSLLRQPPSGQQFGRTRGAARGVRITVSASLSHFAGSGQELDYIIGFVQELDFFAVLGKSWTTSLFFARAGLLHWSLQERLYIICGSRCLCQQRTPCLSGPLLSWRLEDFGSHTSRRSSAVRAHRKCAAVSWTIFRPLLCARQISVPLQNQRRHLSLTLLLVEPGRTVLLWSV
jgi:hypothetical protein